MKQETQRARSYDRHMRLIAPLMIAAAMSGVLSAQARRVTPPQEVATLDELRAKTPDQIARSMMWTDIGAPLIESQRIFVSSFPVLDDPHPLLPPPLDEMFRWGRDICRSAAVVIGRPVFARTLLTRQETLLFTDFQIAIDRWIRPAVGDNQIMVSMGGGRARVAGKTLLEVDTGRFLEVGQVYALFLRWSAQGKTHLINRRGPMPVAGGMVIVNDGRLRDQAAFFKSVSDLADQCPKS